MKVAQLLVFDIDGVLIDVSASYRDVVRYTARQFFRGAPSWEELPDPMFSLEDLAALKQRGGLNNDWDLTALVIDLLIGLVKLPVVETSADNWHRLQHAMLSCDLEGLISYLKDCKNPLTKRMEDGRSCGSQFVRGMYTGDVGSGNIIKQIFQEAYLGRSLFESIYHMPPRLYFEDGYINREKLLIGDAVLAQLSKAHTLAIATGRPRAEADFALERFDVGKYFKRVYALDDCLREERRIRETTGERVSLSKPHPFMLDAIAGELRGRFAKAFYIGDMPDDMVAARSATTDFTAVGLWHSAPDKDSLRNELKLAGAEYLVENIMEFIEILGSDEFL